MVEYRDIPPEQARRISQQAAEDRLTVVHVGTGLSEPPVVYYLRRHDTDVDGGNVIFVEDEKLPEDEAYLCIPEENDSPDTAGCRKVGSIICRETEPFPEKAIPATIEVDGQEQIFQAILQETITDEETDRRIEFRYSG